MSTMYITEPATSGKVCLKTTVGDIDVELWTRECPLACRNFIQLCMESYYDGVIFHRLIKDFIIQTGDPTGTGHGGDSIYDHPFKIEPHQRLQFNRRGLVGMASEDNGNGSQFFFTLDKALDLNKRHTLFGKVVGDTVFNMLRLNECDVDKNERPTRIHKIISTKVLLNPFKDIKPRKSNDEEKRERKKRRREDDRKQNTTSLVASRQTNVGLLSFGDEVEEDEAEIVTFNKKFKSKSAHDVLEDELLSKEKAVRTEELGDDGTAGRIEEDKEDYGEGSSRLDRVKERMRAATRRHKSGNKMGDDDSKNNTTAKEDNDEDMDDLINEQKRLNERAKIQEVSEELKTLQKEYVKAVRGPKQSKSVDEEASISAAMKSHNKMKFKFKSAAKNVVKQADNKRQVQSLSLLDRFNKKMGRASVRGILIDKKIDISDLPSQAQVIESATLEELGQLDLDTAEDLDTEELLNHKLVAPEGIRRDAKDANMKDVMEDWYDIDDPRNKVNMRIREGAPVNE